MSNSKQSARAARTQRSLLAMANELEGKLDQVDQMGAHIAAAHLDAAITRLRVEAQIEPVD